MAKISLSPRMWYSVGVSEKHEALEVELRIFGRVAQLAEATDLKKLSP